MCIRNIDDHIRHNHFCDRQISLNSKTNRVCSTALREHMGALSVDQQYNDHNHFASMQDVSGGVVVSIYT